MSENRKPIACLSPRHADPMGVRWKRHGLAAADWLGARKPLNLILGAVVLIEGVSLLVHLS